MKSARHVVLAFALMALLSCSIAAQDINGPEGFGLPVLVANNIEPWTSPLMPLFEKASKTHDIPLPLLLTLGNFGSAFENRGDAPTIETGYGVMALRENAVLNSLGEGADLTKAAKAKVKINPWANINAAAAVLSSYANQMKIDRSQDLAAWLDPVIKYAGLDEENSRFFAYEVFERLLIGLDVTNSRGERFHFDPQDIGAIDIGPLRPADTYFADDGSGAQSLAKGSAIGDALSAQYPPAIWDPAASCNYTATSTSKNTVVIHTIQGTASGCRSWFKNCNAQVSAHYVTSEAGGVWQCVDEWYKAWHVGCANSYCIGIENEGYAESPSHPQSLYDCAGLLTRDICDSWGIQKQHNGCPPGILGHIDINNCVCGGTHWDPGGGWDWGYFIGVVQGAPPPPTYAAHYVGQSYPASMVAGSTAVAWAEYMNDGTATWGHAATRLGTQSPQDRCSPFYEAGNWLNCGRPTEVDQSAVAPGQVGRFTFVLRAPTTPGNYEEHYRPLQEGVTWFGGDVIFWITVTAANGGIVGTVRSSQSGGGIPGAAVSIAGGGSTTTDANGYYSFSGLNPGPYTLTASKSGYNPSSAGVNVTAGQNATQDFSLVPTDTQAPSVPTNLTAAPVLPTQINLSWTASTDNVGVSGYKVFRDGNHIGTVAGTTYADGGLAPNTSYSYRVSAYDAIGNESAQCSPVVRATPPNEYVIDNPAATFSGSWSTATASTDKYGADYRFASTGNNTNRTATFTPNLPNGGTFDVYAWWCVGTNRATNAPYTANYSGGSETVYVNQQVSGGTWNLLFTGKTYAAGTSGNLRLGNGTGYTGKIVIADAARFIMTSVDAIAPSVPTNLAGNPVSMTQVDLTWTGSTDNVAVAGYNVYRDSVLIGSTAATAYSDTTCAPSTAYSYQVAAYDTAGNVSANSSPANVTTPGDNEAPSIPTDLAGTAVSETQVDLTWTASTDNIGVAGYKIFRDGNQVGTSAGTSYSDTECTINTTYIYTVSAYDAMGNESARSAPAEVTTLGNDTEAPTVPANLQATAVSDTQVDLAWEGSTDNVGVAGYRIFRDNVEIGTTALTTYSDTTCAEYTTYSYQVSAYDASSNESDKSTAAVVTTLDVTAPSVPANLIADAASGTQVDLTWTASTDNVAVTGYKIFRDSVQIGTSATTSFSDTNCTPATTYTYEVSAYDAASNESAKSAPDQATTPDTIAPSVPTNLSATAVSGTQVDLTWTASTDNVAVTGYKVFRDSVQIGTSATTSFSDTNCTPATTYTYEVSAYDAASNESAKCAPDQATTPDTIAPSVPTNLSATAVSGTQVDLTWTASTDNVAVTGYKVFRDSVQIGTSATTLFSDTNCTPATTYTYEVSAYDAVSNESAKGAPDQATTPDTIAPSVPTNLSATAVSGTQVNLTWTASTDNVAVTGYKIFRDSVQIGTSATTSFSDTNCTPATTYTYEVSAYDAASNESAKGAPDQATTFDTIPPTAPTYLQGTAVSQTQIDLIWNASTDNVGVAGYKVFRNGGQIGTSGTTSYSDTTCAPYTTYTYEVSAYDAAQNNSGLSNQAVVTTQGSTDIVMDNPSAVFVGTWFTGTASTDKYGADYNYCTTTPTETKTATWTPGISVPGYYDVYCWYPKGGNRSAMAPFTVTWDGGSQTVAVNQQVNGGMWNTLVSAKRFAAGFTGNVKLGNGTGETSLSVMADAIRFLIVSDDLTAPSVPTNLAASAASASQINLTWTASTDNVGVAGYRVYRNDVEVGTSATASYSDGGLTQYTTYSYKVAAYDAMGNQSALSSPASATTWDGEAPSVPTGVSASAVGPQRINISWNASTDNVGVTGYKVFRNGGYVGSTATTSYSDGGLSPNTGYTYTVSAYDARSNESAQSTGSGATTPGFADIAIDNPAATLSGVWSTGTSSTDKYGADYLFASTAVTEGKTATFTPNIPYAGGYNIYAWWCQGSNRATNSPFFCQWNGGSQTVNVNQSIDGGAWRTLLTGKSFLAGTAGYVRLGNGTGATGKIVIADAARFQQVSGD